MNTGYQHLHGQGAAGRPGIEEASRCWQVWEAEETMCLCENASALGNLLLALWAEYRARKEGRCHHRPQKLAKMLADLVAM